MNKLSALLRGLVAAAGLVMLLGATGPAIVRAQDEQPTVTLLTIDGTITPAMATYVGRGIERAGERGDQAVVIEMDTPGGLSSAMDDIIDDILASEIPVIVYVAPEGSRAASAGVYITYAAHVAAMAPTTNIGSATPIQLGDTDDSDDLSTSERKAINDAVAQIRALAEKRGRNADWAEQAVRDADNITASRAAELGVIDFIAPSRDQLLQMADGRVVDVDGQQVTVRTAGADIHQVDMTFFERILQVVSDPNIAYVLLSLGTLALIFELSNPGLIFPGVAGGLMMVLGFYALGTLDTNWAGLALMVFALVLFGIDVFVPSHGVLTAGGIVAFLVGSLLLANTRNAEVLELSRIVVFTVTGMLALFFIFVAGSIVRIRDKPPATGTSTLVGAVAVVRRDLDPTGMVFIHGELWSATSVDGPIAAGERVVVTGIEGMRMQVAPLDMPADALSEAVTPMP